MGRVERGSFTLTLSQNRAWKSPLTRLFTLNTLCIDITLGSDLYAACRNAIDRLLACRGFDASACTPTPRDLLSSHWQLRLHLIWKVANPLYIDVHLVAHGQVSVPNSIVSCQGKAASNRVPLSHSLPFKNCSESMDFTQVSFIPIQARSKVLWTYVQAPSGRTSLPPQDVRP